MSEHPYRTMPDRAFWSRSVSRTFDASALAASYGSPLLRTGDRVASMGSCFASNLVPYLERAGFEYVRTEQPHPLLAAMGEQYGYGQFSAAYGNIYTARAMAQLLARATGERTPVEDRWHIDGTVVDPFRPGLTYRAISDQEFDLLQRQHLDAVLEAVRSATALVLTLGLTEAWVDTRDGSAFPACPGTIAGTFDPTRHGFVNFTVAEVRDDLREVIERARALNPDLRFIVTVSPVPLVATASEAHVLGATIYSKSVLRAAVEEVRLSTEGVTYFPAYEIVTGPQAPANYYESDRREVTPKAVAAVMGALLAVSETPEGGSAMTAEPAPTSALASVAAAARRAIIGECEEGMMDPDRHRLTQWRQDPRVQQARTSTKQALKRARQRLRDLRPER